MNLCFGGQRIKDDVEEHHSDSSELSEFDDPVTTDAIPIENPVTTGIESNRIFPTYTHNTIKYCGKTN